MNQNQLPIYQALKMFNENEPISFHVPGHKNGFGVKDELAFMKPLLKYDMTELSGLDDFHSPNGAIKEALELLRDFYGTIKSYFLINGSTVGNLAMILAVCKEGDRVLVQRNCHKSILNALKLAKVNPIFVHPKIDPDLKMSGEIVVSDVENAFQTYPDIKAVIITYPSYYGQVYDLKGIIQTAHNHNAAVLADEAHGAHFCLGAPFPPSALNLGADIVVHSAHKTLPSMTMGSYLHINSDRVAVHKVEEYLGILQSSSPSYPIMLSLDYARRYLANLNKADIIYTIQTREWFAAELRKMKGVNIIEKESMDPLKVIIGFEGLSGFELQQLLESQGIYAEMADPYHVLLILPLFKKGDRYPLTEALERIKSALKNVEPNPKRKLSVFRESEMSQTVSKLALTYEEMDDRPSEMVSFKYAQNKIAAEMVIPYPPGIPLMLPGEKITEDHIRTFLNLIETKAHFQGDSERLEKGILKIFQ